MQRIESIGQLLTEHIRFSGRTVVDVGCGTGDLARWLAGLGADVVGVDTQAMVARAEAAPRAGGERYVAGGGEALPLPDASADVVLWVASLHHIPPERMDDAVAETTRVLRPGGLAAFVEPVVQPGSYTDVTHLAEDEAEEQKLAHAAILGGPAHGLEPTGTLECYLLRSFADYERLLGVFVDDPMRRAECLALARPITERHAASSGVAFADFRYHSICRLDLLRRAG